jgi:hypothetical protein
MRIPHLRRRLVLLLLLAWRPLQADDRIFLEAKLNGQPLKLVFDTGAGELVIFRSVAEARGLKISPPPAEVVPKPGQVLFSRTEPVTFELFGRANPETRLGVVDHPASIPPDFDGLVGWPNVRSNIWFISGSELKIHLLPAVPAETAGWIKLPQVPGRSLLALELPRRISGQTAYLGIDTGASSGVRLSPAAWTDWREAHPAQAGTVDAYYMPGAGLVTNEEFWAEEIDLGGVILREVPICRMNQAEVDVHPPGTLAVLGLAAALRLDMVLDGITGSAYLHPLNTPPRRYPHNRVGAVFVPADLERSNALVAHVAPGSPAALAGVRDGDVLLMIDRLDVTPWRSKPGILPLSRFWEQPPGTKIQLKLLRGRENVVTSIMLKDLLGPG